MDVYSECGPMSLATLMTVGLATTLGYGVGNAAFGTIDGCIMVAGYSGVLAGVSTVWYQKIGIHSMHIHHDEL